MFLYKLKKNNYIKIIILLIGTLIFLKQIDFFKKFYFLFTRPYEVRMEKNYKHCGQESIGFLKVIKNKYNIDYKIPIINFSDSPNSSWYYYDLKNKDTNKVIFLNYFMKNSVNSRVPLNNKNFDYNSNSNFSYYLKDYKILYQSLNCYLLEKK
jgi:hypothetical protein